MLVQLRHPILSATFQSNLQARLPGVVSTARIAGLHPRILFCHNPLLLIAGRLLGLPLRASNEGLLRPRVARAQETSSPPRPFPSLTRKRTGDYSQNPIEIVKFMRT